MHEFVILYGCIDRRVLARRGVRRDPARRDDRRALQDLDAYVHLLGRSHRRSRVRRARRHVRQRQASARDQSRRHAAGSERLVYVDQRGRTSTRVRRSDRARRSCAACGSARARWSAQALWSRTTCRQAPPSSAIPRASFRRASMLPSLSIVIPAFDEAASIEATIADALAVGAQVTGDTLEVSGRATTARATTRPRKVRVANMTHEPRLRGAGSRDQSRDRSIDARALRRGAA